MKKVFLALCAVAALFCSCDNNSGNYEELYADFSISKNPCLVGDEVVFTNKTTGGKAPYTCKWTIGNRLATLTGEEVKYSFSEKGTYAIVLNITDAAGQKIERRKNVVVNPAEVPATGTITLNWIQPVDGYAALVTPAIDDEGNIYSGSGRFLRKFDKSGAQLWEAELLPAGSTRSITATPSIDTDGSVYVATGGDATSTAVFKYTKDGTQLWKFNNFYANNGSTAAPNIAGTIIPTIGDEMIYIGNVGTTGTVMSIHKGQGYRNYYAASPEHTGAPAGGCRSLVVSTAANALFFSNGGYGFSYVPKNALDVAKSNPDDDICGRTDVRPYTKNNGTMAGAMLVDEVKGKTCAIAFRSSDEEPATVIAYTVADALDQCEVAKVVIPEGVSNDAGGVVKYGDDKYVVSLNYSTGNDNGGVAIVSLAQGQVLARLRTQEKVSGAAAVDAAGNIIFGTEEGSLYIVKYNEGSADLQVVFKQKVFDLIQADARYKEHDICKLYEAAKVYSSPVIADDGTIYIHIANDNKLYRTNSLLFSLTFADTKAPGTSSWPMMGKNRKHVNIQ